MRIAIICPKYPPDRCGVGDYTYHFCSELLSQNQEIAIWTSKNSPKLQQNSFDRMTTFHVPMPWNWKNLKQLSKEILAWSPDAVIIQYTPQLYAPDTLGVHFFLPFWLGALKKGLSQSKKIILNVHELHYPVQFNPRGILLGIPQYIQINALMKEVDHIIFTYEMPASRMIRKHPSMKDKISTIPVGSNISKNPKILDKEGQTKLLEANRILPHQRLFFNFGGLHPTQLLRPLLLTLEQADQQAPNQSILVCAGSPSEELMSQVAREGFAHLAPLIRPLGYLKEDELSNWYSIVHLVLAPFMDGISTRRGTAMAALSHGKALLTTRAWSTSNTIPWEKFCRIIEATDINRYPQAALDMINESDVLLKLGDEAKEYYYQNFSWQNIVKSTISILQSGPNENLTL